MKTEKLVESLLKTTEFDISSLSGGDINRVVKITQNENAFVLKLNEASTFPEMFQKEANGLKLLQDTKSIKTPEVIDIGVFEELQYLLLAHCDQIKPSIPFWENFGNQLALLHQSTNDRFGLNEDNYIGNLVQTNNWKDTWEGFLIEERLIPQLKLAVDAQLLSRSESLKVERFFNFCGELLPKEKPALIHGDLWSGNYISGVEEVPILIDPAVYYGHREMDIGMMHLFGGFDLLLFEHYQTIYPLEKGWKKRLIYNQLYPLLVHLNLFGKSYWSQIEQIVSPFS